MKTVLLDEASTSPKRAKRRWMVAHVVAGSYVRQLAGDGDTMAQALAEELEAAQDQLPLESLPDYRPPCAPRS